MQIQESCFLVLEDLAMDEEHPTILFLVVSSRRHALYRGIQRKKLLIGTPWIGYNSTLIRGYQCSVV